RLAELVPAIGALRATAAATPSDDAVAAMAIAMSRAVPATSVGSAAGAPVRAVPGRSAAFTRRLVAVVAGAGLLGVGFTGVTASGGDAPGAVLYVLDRALESVGINDGGARERLDEVRALLEAGDVDGALLHAEECTDELDP